MTFMYMGGHLPPTQPEKEARYALDQCSEDDNCQGEFHLEGCVKAK